VTDSMTREEAIHIWCDEADEKIKVVDRGSSVLVTASDIEIARYSPCGSLLSSRERFPDSTYLDLNEEAEVFAEKARGAYVALTSRTWTDGFTVEEGMRALKLHRMPKTDWNRKPSELSDADLATWFAAISEEVRKRS
jgi:hypothetical protein